MRIVYKFQQENVCIDIEFDNKKPAVFFKLAQIHTTKALAGTGNLTTYCNGDQNEKFGS